MSVILLALSILCFLGVAVFATSMHNPEEIHRWIAAGLAFFAAAHLPLSGWGPRP